MTAPATDPLCMQIMLKLADVLGAISQANGFYTDVAAAGIEPLAFDQGDAYPQIVVREEASTVSDSNATGYQDDLVLSVSGYMPFEAGSVAATALRLRDDMTIAIQRIKRSDFLRSDGKPLLSSCGLTGAREIRNSDETENFVEVVVHWGCSYRQFFPPMQGI